MVVGGPKETRLSLLFRLHSFHSLWRLCGEGGSIPLLSWSGPWPLASERIGAALVYIFPLSFSKFLSLSLSLFFLPASQDHHAGHRCQHALPGPMPLTRVNLLRTLLQTASATVTCLPALWAELSASPSCELPCAGTLTLPAVGQWNLASSFAALKRLGCQHERLRLGFR